MRNSGLDLNSTAEEILTRMVKILHDSYERQHGPTGDPDAHRKPQVIKGKTKSKGALLRREGRE